MRPLLVPAAAAAAVAAARAAECSVRTQRQMNGLVMIGPIGLLWYSWEIISDYEAISSPADKMTNRQKRSSERGASYIKHLEQLFPFIKDYFGSFLYWDTVYSETRHGNDM